MRVAGLWLWYLPRNILIAVMLLYRKFISPMYGDVCKFYPSCSAYAVEALHRRGAVVGTALAIWRVVRCHPWSLGGVDRVPGGPEVFDPSVLRFVAVRKVS